MIPVVLLVVWATAATFWFLEVQRRSTSMPVYGEELYIVEQPGDRFVPLSEVPGQDVTRTHGAYGVPAIAYVYIPIGTDFHDLDRIRAKFYREVIEVEASARGNQRVKVYGRLIGLGVIPSLIVLALGLGFYFFARHGFSRRPAQA